jgi:hypothetical protein
MIGVHLNLPPPFTDGFFTDGFSYRRFHRRFLRRLFRPSALSAHQLSTIHNGRRAAAAQEAIVADR